MHSVPLERRRPAAVRRAYGRRWRKPCAGMTTWGSWAGRRPCAGRRLCGGEERRGEAACTYSRATYSPQKGKATTTSKELEESRPHGGRVSTRTFPSYPSTSTTVHLNRVTRCWGARGERGRGNREEGREGRRVPLRGGGGGGDTFWRGALEGQADLLPNWTWTQWWIDESRTSRRRIPKGVSRVELPKAE